MDINMIFEENFATIASLVLTAISVVLGLYPIIRDHLKKKENEGTKLELNPTYAQKPPAVPTESDSPKQDPNKHSQQPPKA